MFFILQFVRWPYEMMWQCLLIGRWLCLASTDKHMICINLSKPGPGKTAIAQPQIVWGHKGPEQRPPPVHWEHPLYPSPALTPSTANSSVHNNSRSAVSVILWGQSGMKRWSGEQRPAYRNLVAGVAARKGRLPTSQPAGPWSTLRAVGGRGGRYVGGWTEGGLER